MTPQNENDNESVHTVAPALSQSIGFQPTATLSDQPADQLDTKPISLPIILILAFFLRPWEFFSILGVLRTPALLFLFTLGWVFLSKRCNRTSLFACSTTKWIIVFASSLALGLPFSMYPNPRGFLAFVISLAPFLAIAGGVRSKRALIHCLSTLLICLDIHAFAVSRAYITGAYANRVTGIFGAEFSGPNSLAAFFVMSLPLAWFLWTESSHKASRLFAVGSAALLLVGILATQSRGGFIGLGALVILSVCFSRHKLRTAISYGAILAIVILSFPNDTLSRFTDISLSKDEMDPSSAARLYAWQTGARMFLDYPIGGVGIGQFGMAFGKQYRGDDFADRFGNSLGNNAFLRPHNIFVQVLAEAGGIAFIAFVMILISSLRSAWRTFRSCNEYSFYAACLISSAIAYFACMLFDQHGFSTPTYALFSLLIIPEIIIGHANNARGSDIQL